eukprot:2228027-Rhodomonas_salina.1
MPGSEERGSEGKAKGSHTDAQTHRQKQRHRHTDARGGGVTSAEHVGREVEEGEELQVAVEDHAADDEEDGGDGHGRDVVREEREKGSADLTVNEAGKKGGRGVAGKEEEGVVSCSGKASCAHGCDTWACCAGMRATDRREDAGEGTIDAGGGGEGSKGAEKQ